MADGEFSRSLSPRVHADPPDARRQGLRFQVGRAHDRLGALCLDDRTASRDRVRPARAQQDKGAPDHGALQAAVSAGRATEPFLSAAGECVMSVNSARITLVTLGVEDLARSIRFYEQLGFVRKARASGEEVAFFDAGGVVLSLFSWQS